MNLLKQHGDTDDLNGFLLALEFMPGMEEIVADMDNLLEEKY